MASLTGTSGAPPGRLRMRQPTATPRTAQVAPTFRLDRPLKGLRVGLRTDPNWLSWKTISAIWVDLLERDGAQATTFAIAEHAGEEGTRRVAEFKAWAAELDCAVVGLGT